MREKLIPALAMLVGLALLFAVTALASGDAMNWYCVREKEHKQPRCDANMRFVEDYDGYYIDHTHDDDRAEKKVYLTFDAGYENGNVAKILDVLKAEQVPGAFFILGHLIEQNGDLVKRMAAEGHTVCNHTFSHRDMTKTADEESFVRELKKLSDAYTALTGEAMAPYYRPPEGRFNEATLRYAQNAGYKTIFWSFAYADWDNGKQMSPEAAKAKILNNVHNGAILLLHPTSATNAAVLQDVITALKADGYTFGTLDELTQ